MTANRTLCSKDTDEQRFIQEHGADHSAWDLQDVLSTMLLDIKAAGPNPRLVGYILRRASRDVEALTAEARRSANLQLSDQARQRQADDLALDATEAFVANRSSFDAELAGLIDGAVATSPPELTVSRPPSAPSLPKSKSELSPPNPRIRERASSPVALDPNVKTVKVEDVSEDLVEHDRHIHPSRRVLLEHQAQPTKQPGISPSNASQPLGTSKCHVDTAAMNHRGRIPLSARAPSLQEKSLSRIPSIKVHRRGTRAGRIVRLKASKKQEDRYVKNVNYEALREVRRNAKVTNVDRYVPKLPSSRQETKNVSLDRFLFEKLPESVQARILEILLVSKEPIKISHNALFAIVRRHVQTPPTAQTMTGQDGPFAIPVSLDQVAKSVSQLAQDLQPYRRGSQDYANRCDNGSRPPSLGLATSVLQVSRTVHELAAPIFYGKNIFHFPVPITAWFQLESFLATIGPSNVARLRKLRVHVPLWHFGIHQDFLRAALLDLMLSVTRMKPAHPELAADRHDRLLSAIEHCVLHLQRAGALTHLSLDLTHGSLADDWIGRKHNQLVLSLPDAEEHMVRKQKGIAMLRAASETLPTKPVVTLYHPTRVTQPDNKEFGKRLADVIREAGKYGWQVDQCLRGPD